MGLFLVSSLAFMLFFGGLAYCVEGINEEVDEVYPTFFNETRVEKDVRLICQ